MKYLINTLLHIADKAESLSWWGYYKAEKPKQNKR
jgi:hypothetical protein